VLLSNLMKFKDPMMTEAIMIALVNKGLPRQEAHKLLREIVSQSQGNLEDALAGNPQITKYLTRNEIVAALNPKGYLGMSEELVDNAVEKTLAERKARGLPA